MEEEVDLARRKRKWGKEGVWNRHFNIREIFTIFISPWTHECFYSLNWLLILKSVIEEGKAPEHKLRMIESVNSLYHTQNFIYKYLVLLWMYSITTWTIIEHIAFHFLSATTFRILLQYAFKRFFDLKQPGHHEYSRMQDTSIFKSTTYLNKYWQIVVFCSNCFFLISSFLFLSQLVPRYKGLQEKWIPATFSLIWSLLWNKLEDLAIQMNMSFTWWY